MRLRIAVTTRATSIPWDEMLRPGRGLIYNLLAETAPDLATHLHDQGQHARQMAPFGHGPPIFPRTRRRPGVYAAGGRGYVEFGSPVPGIVETWIEALSQHTILDWGGVALNVKQLVPLAPPSFTTGRAQLRTATPVVLKTSTRNGAKNLTGSSQVLPYEEGFTVAFEHNLRHKADTLGLDQDIAVERITWIGPKRSLAVKSGRRTGAPITVELRGSPPFLRALWCWGLGEANSAGFGWVSK